MRTIAIVNEKGGTAKTTTAVNLSAALGEMGRRVLLVDLDGQAASSRWLGVEEDNLLADAILRGGGLEPIVDVAPGVSLAPASGKLDSVAHDLRPTQGGQLRKVLLEIRPQYDDILIDCPPSLGNRLIGNALLAATHAIAPVETSVLALDGLRILLMMLEDIRYGFDHDIELLGVVACRYDARTRLSRLVLAELQRALPGKVFKTVIRECTQLQECPASASSILEYAPNSTGAADYRALARELAHGAAIREPMAAQGDLFREPDLTHDERITVVDFRHKMREIFGASDSAEPTAAAEQAEGDGHRPAEQPEEAVEPAEAEVDVVAPRSDEPEVPAALPADLAAEADGAEAPSPPPTPEEVFALEMAGDGESEGEADGAEQDEMPAVAEHRGGSGLRLDPPVLSRSQGSEAEVAPEAQEGQEDSEAHGQPARGRRGRKKLIAVAAAAGIVALVFAARHAFFPGKPGPEQTGAEVARPQPPAPPVAATAESGPKTPAATPPGKPKASDVVPPDGPEPKAAGKSPTAPDVVKAPDKPDAPAEPVESKTGTEGAPAAEPAAPKPVRDALGALADWLKLPNPFARLKKWVPTAPPAPPKEAPAEPPPTAGGEPAKPSGAGEPKEGPGTEPQKLPEGYVPCPPGFDLTCILKAGDSLWAIINGEIVDVGQKINKATVVRIHPEAAELELDGKRFLLRIGQGPAAAPAPGKKAAKPRKKKAPAKGAGD